MSPRTRCAAAALLALLAACREGSSNSLVTNLGLSAVSFQGRGDLRAVVVAEASEGEDLNGDGDAFDDVLFIHHLSDRSLSNLGLALAPAGALVEVGDVLVAFGVRELDQGGADLNGDGDALDTVLFVYDDNTGLVTPTDLALSGAGMAIGGGAVAFAVPETAQGGMDLDGNGSATGSVLHVYDGRTGVSTNAQRAVGGGITFHDHAFGFVTDEAMAGADLNADGDQTDTDVFQLYDLVLGGIVNVALAVRGQPLAVGVDDWFLLVDEAQQGSDENADGDKVDGVYERVEPHLALVQPLGLSSLDTYRSTTDADQLALVIEEVDGVDHNGDGDFTDALAVLHDAGTDMTHAPGLALDPNAPLAFVDGWLCFAVDEGQQQQDLNADGDQFDQVLHALNRTTGAVTNLGLEVFLYEAGIGRLLFSRRELGAGMDLNGDGDLDDTVLFTWIPPSAQRPAGEITSTQLAGTGRASAFASTQLLFVALEGDQGEDLDGDGDTDHAVLVLHDLETGLNRSLGLATIDDEAALDESGRGLALAFENDEGRDLNGDGDTFDQVLQAIRAP